MGQFLKLLFKNGSYVPGSKNVLYLFSLSVLKRLCSKNNFAKNKCFVFSEKYYKNTSTKMFLPKLDQQTCPSKKFAYSEGAVLEATWDTAVSGGGF